MSFHPNPRLGEASRIKVAIIPVGPIDSAILEKYAQVIQTFETIELEEVTRNDPSAQFPNLSWTSGKIRFSYELTTPQDISASDWDGIQAHRKVVGVIGICHCPQWSNLSKSVELFTEIASKLPVMGQRCFAFEPLKEQEDISMQNFFMIPKQDERHLNFYIHRLLADFTDSLVKQFEGWVERSEQVPYISTPLDNDSSADDVKTLKKRRTGRVKKIIGDYCLLVGSHLDALTNYKEALDQTKSKDDFLWHGAVLDGMAEAKVLQALNTSEEVPYDDVIETFSEAIQHYTRRHAEPLAAEAWLKIAGVHSSRGDHIECIKACMECYQIGSQFNARDKIKMLTACAEAASSVGAKRKEAFFLIRAAHLYREVFDYTPAVKLCKDILPAYHLMYEEDINSALQRNSTGILYNGHDVEVNGWPELQAAVLGDVISFATSLQDPQTTAFFTLYLLRRLHSTVPPHIQMHYAQELTKITRRSPNVNVDMIGLPHIVQLTPHQLPPHLRPSKPTAPPPPPPEDGSAPKAEGSPFIYSPFANKQEVKSAAPTWVCDEGISVTVYVNNPLGIPMLLQTVYLSTSGVEFEAYPVAVTLEPFAQRQEVELHGKPLGVGTLVIRGVVIQAFNVMCEHPVSPTGVGVTL